MYIRNQLDMIKNAMSEKGFLIGDFNLDYGKIHDDNYGHKNMFGDFEDSLADFELIQMVKFVTWSRMVGLVRRTPILDHIYVKRFYGYQQSKI